MLTIPADTRPELRRWFAPERPGPLIFEHVVRTGHGRCRVDRWPDPRVVLAELPGIYALRGDPACLADGNLTACAAALITDVRARGHIPTWTTSPDNTASIAVAARLAFVHVRDDVLYSVRTAIPT